MIKKVLTVCYRVGEFCWSYVEEFLFQKEIRPTKVVGTDTTVIGARNTLAVGHRFRGDVGEVM
ncbi:hypothetical protein [Anaerosalibacter sp. Marseille-P3206]|uniref:hypothetical protein n=1 Tax=Anaerosalibacter sp. Marseille-P3206 TaxID=1871005 RepID=UPI0009845C6F|nr:hypothetical protein [Anaerosalibacter sp. Marseille-P3206]